MEEQEKRITQIKTERGRVKGSLTRLEHSFPNVNDKNDLINRLQRLDELLKEFINLDNSLTDEESELEEFENRYFNLKSQFQSKLDILTVPQVAAPITQNVSYSAIPNQNIRLPKLNIPTFSGKFTEWTNFKDLFLSTVHLNSALTNIEKFFYLKNALVDEAASIIRHIPLLSEAYLEAWNKIIERYDKKRQIVHSLIKLFLDQKSIPVANNMNLRNLLNTSDEIIRGLKAVSTEANGRDPWLIYLLVQKLDPESKRLWSIQSADSDFPTLKEFFEFLTVRCSSLDLITTNENDAKNVKHANFVNAKNVNKVGKVCFKCQGSHPLYKCLKFKNMELSARKGFIKKNNLCFLCLNPHRIKECPNYSYLKCSQCSGKHNYLLHEDFKSSAACTVESDNSLPLISSTTETFINSSASFNNSKSVSVLPTAKILLFDSSGKSLPFRALLDSGSECSFVSENVINTLGLKRQNNRILLNGIAGVPAGQTRGSVIIKIGSKISDQSFSLNAYILPKVTSQLPAELLNVTNLEYLKNISLADEDFMIPRECDVILGSDCFFDILRYGKIVGTQNQPIAQNTMFGWVIAGKIEPESKPSKSIQSHFSTIENSNIDITLQKFWESEEVVYRKPQLSEEEQFSENHFQSTYKINDDGRFEVKLPVYKDICSLGDSRAMAVSRLFAMERKFQTDNNFENEYKNFMREYEQLGHMTCVNNSDITDKKLYYLPHHAVLKEDSISTKLRVVFDGSCKPPYSNSLNSILAVGQIPQSDLFSILLRFRLNPIAFTADIQQMYRQILIASEDRDLQRIVWRESRDSVIKDFNLNTVTYGTSSAPFLATRCLFQISKDIEKDNPIVSNIIKESFYIDDLMCNSTSSQESIILIKELSAILEERGFHLRKWRSNSIEVLSHLASNCPESTLEIHPDECTKTLGLMWDSKNDYFIFKVNLNFCDNITKRIFLSQSSRLFDPLGFLAPCTIAIKIFYQQMWLIGLKWDTPLPENLKEQWKIFQKEFNQLSVIKIPRWIQATNKELILHGFCDASELAYAAIIYVVQPQRTNRAVTILVAKSKVAPLKPISIPRLELNGALLLSRLYATIVNIFQMCTIKFHAWTDSQVVLSWLSSHPRVWKPYIANRTVEILESVPSDCWRYVPSKENPADIASRGLSPKDLPRCSLWWEGPPWLSLSKEHWPANSRTNLNSDDVIKEKKNSKFCFSVFVKNSIIDSLFDNFSVISKIIDILAICFRFIRICKEQVGGMKEFGETGKFYPLSTTERRHAGNFIISYVQHLFFEEEITAINSKKQLSKKSKLSALCPFIDKDGLLRVGGRLQNAPLHYNTKHPIILPTNHKISVLLVKYFHILNLHAGLNTLLSIIRQCYWIIGAKKLIKKCVYQCITCCRYRATPANQLMGDLPINRVTPSRPFLACGLDYGGPVNILRHRGRGAKVIKGYIAVFVCFATKAVHLELVSDLTSEAFIAALRRFCARRGAPQHIYSDNATTFVGAKKILSELYKFVSKINCNEQICYYLAQMKIEWHMIPPVSPHFGGLWEAAVKSTKFHLKRVIGNTNLTFEEYSTLLAQIEAILNSRPLVSIDNSTNSDSLNVLTPSHFLTGDVITTPGEQVNDNCFGLKSRWDIVQKLKLCFWKKWQVDYLSSLQNRKKWRVSNQNFKINDIVLLKEDNVPPAVWPLGRIIDTHPGKDNIVRVVTVKTARGNFKRPIVKLCLLPIHQE